MRISDWSSDVCSSDLLVEQRLLEALERAIGFRHDPCTGALEQRQRFHLRHDLRYELDRAGAGADHRDRFAAEVVIVIPARRMKHLAAEILDALELRCRGAVELTELGRESCRERVCQYG